MNGKIIIALICLVLTGFQSLNAAEGDSLWSRTFGGGSNDYCKSVIETSDGGFVMAGITASLGSGGNDMWLVKTNAPGDSLWSRAFGGSGNDYCNCVIQTSDGGFLLAGVTNSLGSGSDDMWLVKTDAQGDSLWSRTIGGASDDRARAVLETADGGFLVAGEFYYLGSGWNDMALVKLNAQGDSLWSRIYGGSGYDETNALIESSDGSFLLAGYTDSFGSGLGDMWLVNVSLQGDSLWSHTYGRSGNDYCNSVIQTSDGGFLLAGVTNVGLGSDDMWMVKTNSQGDSLWSTIVGDWSDDRALAAIEAADGGFLMAGHEYFLGAGWNDMCLVKTDSAGSVLWLRLYGGSGYDEVHDLIKISTGDYLLAGYTDSYGSGMGDIWMLCAEGLFLPEIELSDSFLDFGAIAIGQSADLTLTIYNVGRDTLVLYNCACGLTAFSTNWNPADSLILPGDSLEIIVTFAPEDSGSYLDTLCIENNCELCGVELLGHGEALGISNPASAIPDAFALRGPYPNPFNPATTFKIELPMASWVKLEIYDIGGKSVATVIEGWRAAGYHDVPFDGNSLSSGVYLYQLDADDFTTSGKMVLLK